MLKHKRLITILSLLLALIFMVAIFNLSNQPAEVSKMQSGTITEWFLNLLGLDDAGWTVSKMDGLTRKIAHFLEYSVLGFVMFFAVGVLKLKREGSGLLVALCICVLYAASDEVHQLFVAGRSFESLDILLDSFGALCGIALAWFCVWAIGRPWFKQIKNFLIVGFLGFFVDYILLFIFTEYFHWMYLVSAALSFSIYTVVVYVLSMRFVFKGRSDRKKSNEFAVFFLLNLIGLGIDVSLLWVMVSKAGMHYMLGKIFVEAVVMVWNYISRKMFIEEK